MDHSASGMMPPATTRPIMYMLLLVDDEESPQPGSTGPIDCFPKDQQTFVYMTVLSSLLYQYRHVKKSIQTLPAYE